MRTSRSPASAKTAYPVSWYSSGIVGAAVVVVVDVVVVVVLVLVVEVLVDVVDVVVLVVVVLVLVVVGVTACVTGESSGATVLCVPTLSASVSLVTSTDTVPHAAVDMTSRRSPATRAGRAAIDRTVPVARLVVRASSTVHLGRVTGAASTAAPAGRYDNHPFIQACRGLPHDRVPVWFMRQAGRSLPEYRAIRGTGTILDAIADPDLSTEITLQPIRRYDVDAAILYSDIVVPAHAVGFGLTVTPGVGPEVERPFRHEDDLARLRPLDPEADTPYVLETVRQLVAELDRPLIGFAGAPFTVASYLIEGRPCATTRTPRR